MSGVAVVKGAERAGDAATIRNGEEARLRAFVAGDIPVLESLLHDALSYTHGNGKVDTKQEFLDGIRAGRVRFSDARLVEADVRFVGETGLFNGRFHLTVHVGDKQTRLDSRQLAVWIKGDAGRWLQVATASTRLPTGEVLP